MTLHVAAGIPIWLWQHQQRAAPALDQRITDLEERIRRLEEQRIVVVKE